MHKNVSFHTLGCRLNQAETAILKNLFIQEGFYIDSPDATADIIVINSCTVTAKSDTDTRRLVNKINRINEHARIAIIGCQAQTQTHILAEYPGVSWVIGSADKMKCAQIIKDSLQPATAEIVVRAIPKRSFTVPSVAGKQYRTRANLKIQDGCDCFCSYCEIPYARGRARSRIFRDIIKEARTLAEAGHKEIILTGINLVRYTYRTYSLLDVINCLEDIPGLERIRFSSLEPPSIPNKIIKKMAEAKKVCRFLHLPIQSGCDATLRRMNRKYTTRNIQKILTTASSTVNDLCLGTDIIVGFPGETDKEFEGTYSFLEKSAFHYFHVFSYSDRINAVSKDLPNKIQPDIIRERSSRLRSLGVKKRNAFLRTLINKTYTVLFEERKKGAWSGYTDNFVRVHVKSSRDLSNTLYPVVLKKIENNCFIGTVN